MTFVLCTFVKVLQEHLYQVSLKSFYGFHETKVHDVIPSSPVDNSKVCPTL